MDRGWLEQRLGEGRSLASIAAEAGKGPSTVAYWINKHGLVAAGSARHRAKGALDEGTVRDLVERGLSVRQIAAELDRSPAAVRHWLRRFGLETRPRYLRGEDKPDAVVRECPRHGWVRFELRGSRRTYRCAQCIGEGVTRRRRRVKEILVAEAGGACRLCGYDRYAGALHFHHVDPARKRFEIGGRGLTRALALLREEAGRCILLCGNCHAEVESGVTQLPFAPASRVNGSRPATGDGTPDERSGW